MTIGEKIRMHRIRIGLSQEELGEKLLVSRQTVSLWEMDKTVPTVDNLVRLRDVFGVSIDGLLTNEEEAAPETDAPADAPKERYSICFTESDTKDVYRYFARATVKRTVLYVLLMLVLFCFAAGLKEDTGIGIGFVFGMTAIGVTSYVKGYRAQKKAWQASAVRLLKHRYAYAVYENEFTLDVSREGAVTKAFRFSFSEIEHIRDTGRFFLVSVCGELLILKKELLTEDSFVYRCCKSDPSKLESDPQRNRGRAISWILFVCSILSFFVSLAGVAVASAINRLTVENMWVLFLFTPIPIASIVCGFVFRGRGYPYKKNIIVGFIVAALLCVYGSFSFLFAGLYTHTDEPIIEVEQTVGIDLPPHAQITTQDWSEGSDGETLLVSDVYFEDDVAKAFEAQMETDSRWLTTVSSELLGVASSHTKFFAYDAILIYNVDTEELNQLPKENGTYRWINLLYDWEKHTLQIIQYELEYVQ